VFSDELAEKFKGREFELNELERPTDHIGSFSISGTGLEKA